MSEVKALTVKDLLKDSSNYLVPMYQRNYAWGEGEINQLILDVFDYQQKNAQDGANQNYYIGTLVVFKRKDGSYEVIDGQQRFTTLSLLVNCLKSAELGKQERPDMDWYSRINIDFESRPKSRETFLALSRGNNPHTLRGEQYNEGVVKGYELITKKLKGLKDKLPSFSEYLFNNVQITRVEVPEDTDLNHYFEVMNNRGEQLEKHEVIKAQLMSVLSGIKDEQDRVNSISALNKVWEACANMERYVQYGFSPAERHSVFGKENWGFLIPVDFRSMSEALDEKSDMQLEQSNTIEKSFSEILQKAEYARNSNQSNNALGSERFNSVINFSNFLMHVLRVWSKKMFLWMISNSLISLNAI